MIRPAKPADEEQRLATLRALNILDTPPEERFDRITRLAQAFFNVPISLVSLIAANRQWFKSKQGLSAAETPRDISICGHAILQEDIFLVPDAREDPRFFDNPLITGDPFIRFYAGCPLSAANGSKLGTLCIIDRKPRQLDEKGKQVLKDLAAMVENELNGVELNKALGQARDVALESSRLKSEFLANMSHEIRTPINAIIGMSEILVEAELKAEEKEQAEAIHQAGNALLTIVNDILDLSKIEADKMTLEKIDFNLKETIQGAVQLLSHRAQEKGLGLSALLASDLPDCLRGDPVRLRQVLTNLLANAVKFTERGRVTLSVTWEDQRQDTATLRFEVKDTGIGIPEQAQAKLFKSFSQADSSTTRQYGGTGLGLTICKKLVELMGGEIGFASAAGQGSTFWFSLSFEKAVGSHNSKSASAPTVKRSLPSPDGQARILLVEDNAVNRKVALTQLKKLGYEAETAENGEEALAILARQIFDLILMDCQMPVLDGMAATARIRTLPNANAYVPIIAMTASAMEGDREKCLSLGMSDYISKPIRAKDLAEIIFRWTAVLDPSAIEELRGLEGEGAFEEVAQLFLEDTPKLLKSLQSALERGDAAASAQAAHALRGQNGNLGARKAQALCGLIERSAVDSNLSQAKTFLEGLEPELDRVREEIQKLRRQGHGAEKSRDLR